MNDSSKLYSNYFYKFALTVALLSACVIFTNRVELTNAWNGWSPVGFTWALEDAHLRDHRDFYHFVFKREHLLNSLANWIYPLAYKYFAIDPSFTQIVFIIGTTIAYSLSIFYFVKIFITGIYFYPSAVFAITLALFTNAINCNLASFGQANLSLGQAYGVAVPLQLLALTATIRKNLVWAGIVMGVLVFVHISIGLMTAFVGAAMVLSCWDQLKRPSALTGICILSICSVAWTLYISRTFDYTTNFMDLQEWVDWERMMNYHFFPFDTGVFTTNHDQGVSPFLSLSLVALSSGNLSKMPDSVLRMWLVGLIVSFFITVVGLIISIYPPSFTMVMLALHRSSGITLLLLLPIVVWRLIDLFCSKELISVIFGFACILPFFLHMTWGVPTIPAIFVAAMALFAKENPLPKWQKRILISLLIITIFYAIFLLGLGYAKPLKPSIIGDFYLFLIILFLVIGKVHYIKYNYFEVFKNNLYMKYRYSYLIIMKQYLTIGAITLLVSFSIYLNSKMYPTVDVQLARSYLDAQQWAQTSTDPTAVFMPDPGMPLYGRSFSEFSRRASYGSVREWLHVPLVYSADVIGFKEGTRRLSLLGINPYFYKENAFTSPGKNLLAGHSRTIDSSRAAYYAMSPENLIDLAHKEGINFFIFDKNYVNPPPNLVSVYENNDFIICVPAVPDLQSNDT